MLIALFRAFAQRPYGISPILYIMMTGVFGRGFGRKPFDAEPFRYVFWAKTQIPRIMLIALFRAFAQRPYGISPILYIMMTGVFGRGFGRKPFDAEPFRYVFWAKTQIPRIMLIALFRAFAQRPYGIISQILYIMMITLFGRGFGRKPRSCAP